MIVQTSNQAMGLARVESRRVGRFGLLLAGCVYLAAVPVARGDDVHLDMLKTRTGSFTNVTVYARSRTDIFIRHANGLGNVKIEQIADRAAMRALGLAGDAEESPHAAGSMAEVSSKMKSFAQADFANLQSQCAQISSVNLSPNLITLIVAVTLGVYFFSCYCFKLICVKAGKPPGALIWFPVVQMIPLLRAAGMSGWWLLGFFVPLLNLVASILWSFKIVQARGKSVWVAIGLLLPLTNIVAFLYLAFSDGGEDAAGGRLSVSGPPVPAEA